MSTMTSTEVALPYHEPDIVTVLILSSFLLLLNIVNHVMDRITYIGLLGQIFIGIAWGTPAGNWLGIAVESVIVNMGYLGLLLMVFEGGLTTSFTSLKANLRLSSVVAVTGVSLPIGLSYILVVLADATPLQAFAAGAALCSTSLGTTFTMLRTSGLHVTRLGIVLTSAAMMDDVVGLVMVQVISNLGTTSDSFNAATVVRPVFVSLAFGALIPLACRFVVLPLTMWINRQRARYPDLKLWRILILQETIFVVHTLLFVSMVTAATYAGTSNLFAAYMTGAAISWWDSDVSHDIDPPLKSHRLERLVQNNSPRLLRDAPVDNQGEQITPALSINTNRGFHSSQIHLENTKSRSTTSTEERNIREERSLSGSTMFETYYTDPLKRILQPFFFASIGFSIPITRMFTGSIIWRGAIYTVLMFLGKFACGLWLVQITRPRWLERMISTPATSHEERVLPSLSSKTGNERIQGSEGEDEGGGNGGDEGSIQTRWQPTPAPAPALATRQANLSARIPSHRNTSHQTSEVAKPTSLYPGTIVGCAMVARGEIGFLISSLAEANRIFGEEPNAPLFLVVTWAIMLCTVIGPICVGLVVKRLRSLSQGHEEGQWRRDVLGVWGVG